MKSLMTLTAVLATFCMLPLLAEQIENPKIDFPGFQDEVIKAGPQRELRRVTEAEFLEAMRESGVVLLDARSADKYALRHIDGAVNLPFTDFTEESLAALFPTRDTKILIYCNNNFDGSPIAFPSKCVRASLNLSTFAALRTYGYENIYELGPLLDVATTGIPFAGTEVQAK